MESNISRKTVAAPLRPGTTSLRNRLGRCGAFACAGLLAYDAAPAAGQCQPQWVLAQSSPPMSWNGSTIAMDNTGGALLFSSAAVPPWAGTTWRRDGAAWSQVLGTHPSARHNYSMIFNSGRAVFVLFGGEIPSGGGYAGDTWEFSGQSWIQVASSGPSPRIDPALSYDPVRGRTVLFGGKNNAYLADTWEWDGIQWALRAQTGPSPRIEAGMAFDPVSGKTILFGGVGPTGVLGDTWAWDGALWAALPNSGPLPQEAENRIVLDPEQGRVVLLSKDVSSGAVDATWGWDGAGWVLLSSDPPELLPASSTSLSFDAARQRIVAWDHNDSGDELEWNGSTWNPVGLGFRSRHSLVFDVQRGRVFLSPWGNRGSWEWDGSRWSNRNPHMTAGQSVSRGALGSIVRVDAAETSTWDGSQWTVIAPSGPVPSSYLVALSFDSARYRVVLFGGSSNTAGTIPNSQTWEFDGSGWTLRTSSGPSQRIAAAMAYDPVRERTVLFGGFTNGASNGETWEWDGSTWTQRAVPGPAPRFDHAMAYVPDLGGVVLNGGGTTNPDQWFADTWLWNGTAWAQIETTGAVPPHSRSGLAYDPTRRRLVFYGGIGGAGYAHRGNTWELVLCPPVCYPNCDASTAPPTLNVADFICFMNKYAAGNAYANCDGSTLTPNLNVADFICFMNKYAGGCP